MLRVPFTEEYQSSTVPVINKWGWPGQRAPENAFVTSRHADWVSFSMTLFTLPAYNLLINLHNNTILYFSTAFHSGNSKYLASIIKSSILTHK